MLIGEGKYNLNAIKEIKVTESFLGLDKDDRSCQNHEYLEDCTTNQFISSYLHQGGCIPFNLRSLMKEVRVNN